MTILEEDLRDAVKQLERIANALVSSQPAQPSTQPRGLRRGLFVYHREWPGSLGIVSSVDTYGDGCEVHWLQSANHTSTEYTQQSALLVAPDEDQSRYARLVGLHPAARVRVEDCLP